MVRREPYRGSGEQPVFIDTNAAAVSSHAMCGAGHHAATTVAVPRFYAPKHGLPNCKGHFGGCGAIVTGINGVDGSSCFDVHERLNLKSDGSGSAIPACG